MKYSVQYDFNKRKFYSFTNNILPVKSMTPEFKNIEGGKYFLSLDPERLSDLNIFELRELMLDKCQDEEDETELSKTIYYGFPIAIDNLVGSWEMSEEKNALVFAPLIIIESESTSSDTDFQEIKPEEYF